MNNQKAPVPQKQEAFNKSQKTKDVRMTNIRAAKYSIRTSLGPRGMDKMIQDGRGQVLITNDGATILQKMQVVHPIAKMLVEISKAQDIQAGDGTTTVVVIAGALLKACQTLLQKGLHPNTISEGIQIALDKSLTILKQISVPIDLSNKQSLIECVNTSLSSKVVSSSTSLLSPIAVDAVLRVLKTNETFDLKDIRVVKRLGGTIDDTQLIDGLIFDKVKPSHKSGGPTKKSNAKVALVQFQISTPKTDIENSVLVKDYQAMDRIMKQQRKIIAQMVKKISSSGVDVLLIQKSILKDSTNDLSLHFLAKKGIMVVDDIQRQDVPYICKATGCIPIAHIDSMNSNKFGLAVECAQIRLADDTKIFRILGSKQKMQSTSILIRGSNPLIIDQAERSLHDALCVLRCLVKNKSIVAGGSAPQIQITQKLEQYSRTCQGADSLIIKAFAQALQVIPFTLAQNAGMNSIAVVTDIRNRHAKGQKFAGISVKKGVVSDIMKQNVIQPSLVTHSALTLATQVVRMIMKIDDLVLCVQ